MKHTVEKNKKITPHIVTNDEIIRSNFFKIKLHKIHTEKKTLVINELGLKHGKCRADIAVLDKSLHGYEIKSDKDSLRRLQTQIELYNTIFDYMSVVVGEKYSTKISDKVPEWWGIIVCSINGGIVTFQTIRKPKKNSKTDSFSIAQLLWREEVQKILINENFSSKEIKQKRSVLYKLLSDLYDQKSLKDIVKLYLKNRISWRDHSLFSLCGG